MTHSEIISSLGIQNCTLKIVKNELSKVYPREFIEARNLEIKEVILQVAAEENDKSAIQPNLIQSFTSIPQPVLAPQDFPKTSKKSEPKKSRKDTKISKDSQGGEGVAVTAKTNKFNQEYALSGSLAALIDVEKCSRPQTVKKIWHYIKENGLQDTTDKRYINCDEKMKKVFGTRKLHMFTMNKLLSEHFEQATTE